MDDNTPLAAWERELLEGPPRVAPWFHITASMVVLALLDIIERFGEDHIPPADDNNERCIYAVKAKSNALVPVCIVGQVLSDFGILALALESPNDYHVGISCASPSNVGNVTALTDSLLARGVEMDTAARYILSEAQWAQDNGNPWGEAVNRAFAKAEQNGYFSFPETNHLTRAKMWQENLI